MGKTQTVQGSRSMQVSASGARYLAQRPVLVLARDPAVIAAAHDAARAVGAGRAVLLRTGQEALDRLADARDTIPGHLVCDPDAAGSDWGALLSTLAQPAAGTALVVVTRGPMRDQAALRPVPAEAAPLAQALRQPPSEGALSPDIGALAQALRRGEISVDFQPVVRLHDRRPVLVEALARWQRPGRPVPPDAFVPLAERSGLARALSILVASRAAAELGRLRPRLRLGLAFNLPLALLVQPDLTTWLRQATHGSGLRPRDIAIELTETTTVRDQSSLRQALQRLRAAGYQVLLDDLGQDDPRRRLLALPFTGVKLDRVLVQAAPVSARARRCIQALVQEAHGRGQRVTAEGVSDPIIWQAMRGLGVDLAQGFGVARPLPAASLPGWSARWRRG